MFKLSLKPPFIIYVSNSSCECGKYKKCCREIYSSNGKLWIETDEHFKCGKIQKQVNDIKKWCAKYSK